MVPVLEAASGFFIATRVRTQNRDPLLLAALGSKVAERGNGQVRLKIFPAEKPEFVAILLSGNRKGSPVSGFIQTFIPGKKRRFFNALKRCFKMLIFDWKLS